MSKPEFSKRDGNSYRLGCTQVTIEYRPTCKHFLVTLTNKGFVKDEEKEFTARLHAHETELRGLICFIDDVIHDSRLCYNCGQELP